MALPGLEALIVSRYGAGHITRQYPHRHLRPFENNTLSAAFRVAAVADCQAWVPMIPLMSSGVAAAPIPAMSVASSMGAPN